MPLHPFTFQHMANFFYQPPPLDTLPAFFHITESTWISSPACDTGDEITLVDDKGREDDTASSTSPDAFASFRAISEQHKRALRESQGRQQSSQQSQSSKKELVVIQKRSEQIAIAEQTYGTRSREIMAMEAKLDSLFDAVSPQSVLWPSIPLRFQ